MNSVAKTSAYNELGMSIRAEERLIDLLNGVDRVMVFVTDEEKVEVLISVRKALEAVYQAQVNQSYKIVHVSA